MVPTSLSGALSDLLLMAAREVHGERGPFAKHGEFPNANLVSLPLSHAAVRYYERGPSTLWRVLPFRLATLVDRFMWVAALLAELDDIDRISASLRVPKGFRPDYLGLRQDIHDVRSRVKL